MRKVQVAVSGLLALMTVSAVQAAADIVEFVSCPVYRDARAGKKSGCWLADAPESGIRFDISASPVKPDWNYAVLVQGQITDNSDACGGKVLNPVRVSVLSEPCPQYRLPAEGYPGTPFVRPANIVKPLSVDRAPLTGPFEDKQFHVFFDYNKSFLTYQFGDYQLDEAAYWILQAKPSRVVITGFADTHGITVSGHELREKELIAQDRADIIVTSLLRLGVPEGAVATKINMAPEQLPGETDGVSGLVTTSRWRVTIDAYFD